MVPAAVLLRAAPRDVTASGAEAPADLGTLGQAPGGAEVGNYNNRAVSQNSTKTVLQARHQGQASEKFYISRATFGVVLGPGRSPK